MKNLNKIIWFLLGGVTLVAGSVLAVNLQPSFVPSLVPIIDSNYDLGTSTKLWRYIYMAGSDGCLQLSTNLITSTGIACGSGGGGSGGGSWSTTTSTHTGRLINYPNNTTDIVVIGGTATTTSNTEYWFDPNTQNAHIGSASTASTTIMGDLMLSNIAQGLIYTGTNSKLNAVSTSTLTASSPLTGSFVQIGTGGALGCQTASASQAGCLSLADWNTFNNKVATSASETMGQLSFWTTTNGTPPKLASVATSTATCSSGVSCSAFTVVGSVNPSFTNSGVTSIIAGSNITISGATGGVTINSNGPVSTSTNETVGQLAYWTTTSATPALLGKVATSSETCSSPLSCTAHDVLTGGGAISLTTVPVSLGGTNATSFASNSIITSNAAGTTLIATTSQLTVGSILATSTSSNSIFLNNWFGIGTSTPHWPLQISSSTVPQFSLGDSTNPQWTMRNAGGNFYIGTSSATTFATTTNPWLSTVVGGVSGLTGFATSTPQAVIDVYTNASTTNMLLESAAGKGGCLIIQDVGSTPPTYTELYTSAGKLFTKVSTSLTTCN